VVFSLCVSLTGAAATQCNVKDYGAVGDGVANDTDAFVKAFEACTEKGGPSTVYVPPGSYSVWPLVFERSECTDVFFNMTGALLAPSSPLAYQWVKNVSYLLFRECQNLTLHGWGAGVVDGQGQVWWDLFKLYAIPDRPKLVMIEDSDGVTIRDIRLENSPMYHIVPEESANVLIEGVEISAPGDSPNTDGIDPTGSRHVVIRNCIIGTGDDNVAVKAGSEDVLVEDCLFLSGHGCSIGSINTTGVRNVVLRNINFVGTENGARIKTWQGGSGLVENISYIDLKMEGVGLPLKINMYYCTGGGCHNQTKGVTIRNILFSGIEATQTGGLAGQFYCSDTVPCTGITMENIAIWSHDQSGDRRLGGGNEFECWKAFGETRNVSPAPCLVPD
jgi:polygalacturonase